MFVPKGSDRILGRIMDKTWYRSTSDQFLVRSDTGISNGQSFPKAWTSRRGLQSPGNVHLAAQAIRSIAFCSADRRCRLGRPIERPRTIRSLSALRETARKLFYFRLTVRSRLSLVLPPSLHSSLSSIVGRRLHGEALQPMAISVRGRS
jgi:hypothetical protein